MRNRLKLLGRPFPSRVWLRVIAVSLAFSGRVCSQTADGLQSSEYFTLSADGSKLAYTRRDHNSNLWRVTLPTAEKRAKPEISRLTSGTSYYGEPSFSPDAHWIAFALGPEGTLARRQGLGQKR